MEKFLFVVLLLVIVANVINLKKRTKGALGGKFPAGNPTSGDHSGPGGSWKKLIETFSSDGPSGNIRRSGGDENHISGQAEPVRWEEGMPRQNGTRQDRRSPGFRGGRENIHAPLIERRAKEAPPSISRPGAPRDDVQKPVKDEMDTYKRSVPETKPAAHLSVLGIGGYSVAQLQRAVVWGEVLGPPVALRKGHGE